MISLQTVVRVAVDGDVGTWRTTLETKVDMMPHQERGLSYTATGYGHKIPTTYKVKHNNRWKRVYCRVFSNIGSLYILSGANEISIDQE